MRRSARCLACSEADPAGQRFVGHGDRPIIDAVQAVAQARGVPMAQVALAWVLGNPVVAAPIVGPTSPGHLTDATAALDLKLTAAEMDLLEGHYGPRAPSGFS